MVDLSDEPVVTEKVAPVPPVTPVQKAGPKTDETRKLEVKPLTDVSVTLESIKPSLIPPVAVIEEKNGISVTLYFAKETPRDDVSVVVVTTISKNLSPLTNYLFQAVVPKVRKQNKCLE